METIRAWHEGTGARLADWRRRFRLIVLCMVTLAMTSEMAAAQVEKLTSPVVKAAISDSPASDRAWWKKCVALRDDRARLACFDASAPGDGDNPDMRLRPSVAAPTSSASAQPAVSPAQPLSEPLADARAVTYRVALGYGLGIGGHAGSFDIEGGTLRTRAGLGSEGDTLSVQGWVDNWVADDWSAGLEYLYLNNVGKLDLNLPDGVSVLTDPVTAHARADLHGHIGFANIAYRPEGSFLRPYIGVGLGLGWGSASTKMAAQNAFAGYYYYESRGSSLFGATQGFLGIDMPLYDNWYVSAFGKALWIPGHPLNVDQRYLDFVFGGAIGRQL